MEWRLKNSKTWSLLIIPIWAVLPFALAEESKYVGEDYYENDIDAAVLEAQQNKRQLNYNKQHWYNRTTSKSFPLESLATDELEEQRLEGGVSASAAGNANTQITPDLPFDEQGELVQRDQLTENQKSQLGVINNQESIPESVTGKFTPVIIHSHQKFDVKTTDVYSSTTIISTPRP